MKMDRDTGHQSIAALAAHKCQGLECSNQKKGKKRNEIIEIFYENGTNFVFHFLSSKCVSQFESVCCSECTLTNAIWSFLAFIDVVKCMLQKTRTFGRKNAQFKRSKTELNLTIENALIVGFSNDIQLVHISSAFSWIWTIERDSPSTKMQLLQVDIA